MKNKRHARIGVCLLLAHSAKLLGEMKTCNGYVGTFSARKTGENKYDYQIEVNVKVRQCEMKIRKKKNEGKNMGESCRREIIGNEDSTHLFLHTYIARLILSRFSYCSYHIFPSLVPYLFSSFVAPRFLHCSVTTCE